MNENANIGSEELASQQGCCPPQSPSCNEIGASASPKQMDDHTLAEYAKSLAHPVRVHIIKLLARQNTCMCAEVVNDLGLPQSTVSQHLKVLHQSGLVSVSDEGRSRRYCVNQNGLRHLRSLIVDI